MIDRMPRNIGVVSLLGLILAAWAILLIGSHYVLGMP